MRTRAAIERFALREAFTIARGAKTEAVVVVATITDGAHVGRGECLPYARYGETPEAVARAIEACAASLGDGLDRPSLLAALPPGAARNALDLALLDLEAKRSGVRAHTIVGLPTPRPITSVYTLPMRDPDTTRAMAAREAARPVLKLKLGGGEDLARVRAAREGAPHATLLVDANEGWDRPTLERMGPALGALGVALIEQPLPARDDAALDGYEGPVPLCADESFHGEPDALEALSGRFAAVNVKLDKQGGLTTAIAAVRRARALDLGVMIGTMVASSLGVAPAVLLAAAIVGEAGCYADVDGSLFLAHDRPDGLRFEGSVVHPPSPALWG